MSLHLLPSLADTFTWLLRSSLRAAAATIVVLAVRAIFRRRLPARWRYALWLAVPIACLLPRLPQIPVSVAQYTSPVVTRYVVALDDWANPPGQISARASVPLLQYHRLEWREIAVLTWVAGVMLLSATWIVRHQSAIRHIRRNAQPADASLLELVDECARQAGLRRAPAIVESTGISSPAVAGILRPLLLLPCNLRTPFSSDEVRLMLLHELAHIRRGDLLTNVASALLLAIHWFNPILWFAASRMRADREAACDATVLAISQSDERAAYGNTLLKLQAELSGISGHPAFVGIFENGRQIRDRILRIGSFRRGGFAWGLAALVVTIGLLTCLAIGQSAQPAAAPAKKTAAVPPPSLEQRLGRLAAKGLQVEVEGWVREIKSTERPILMNFFGNPDLSQLQPGSLGLMGVWDSERRKRFEEQLPPPNNPRENPRPRVTTRVGQRAVIEIIRELRHPATWSDPEPGKPHDSKYAVPVEFETRNLGVTLEVEPQVASMPKQGQAAIIDLELSPQLVFFTGWEQGKTKGGYLTNTPIFSTTRHVLTSVSVYDGQTIAMLGEMDLPDEDTWGFKNADQSEVATHRGIILWLVTPRIINANGQTGPNGPLLASELFQPRDWQFTNLPIEQCIAHFIGMSRLIDPNKRGLNIVLGKPAAEKRNVTLDLKQTSLINALEFTAKAAGLRAEENENNTVILMP